MPGDQRSVNLEDIARLAGVSRSTVSRVINNYPHVHPETRRKVLEVVDREHFHPNLAARTLVTQRTRVLGFVTPQRLTEVFEDPYFHVVIQGVSSTANQHDYSVMLWVGEGIEEQKLYQRTRHSRLIDGLIVASVLEGDPLVMQLADDNFPCVLIGRPPCEGLNSVDVDNCLGARVAVEHLVHLGYQRIGTITGRRDMSAGQERLEGYESALRAANRPINPAWIVTGDFSERSGYVGMKVLLNQHVDAVFCAGDLMAMGAMRAIHEQGLRIPDDVALVGFDDLPLAAAVNPPLTTIRQPIQQLGSAATEALINLLEGDLSTPYRAVLPTELIVRASCGAMRRLA